MKVIQDDEGCRQKKTEEGVSEEVTYSRKHSKQVHMYSRQSTSQQCFSEMIFSSNSKEPWNAQDVLI